MRTKRLGVPEVSARKGGEPLVCLTSRGIPVMGHVGLTPQSVHALGGIRLRGSDDASAIEQAGAVCVAIEAAGGTRA